MKRIHRLNDQLIAQIAAGEVIESPAAIVKELVENSVDAGSTSVDIRITGDGFGEIQVRDDGSGIHSDDLPLAVESFATSKISTLDELIGTNTMGFRGEALGSIAAVSRLRLESRPDGAATGAAIQVDENGRSQEPSPIEKGTRVLVRDLFYNVPVRRDYFQNAAKIRRQIAETLTSLAVSHPAIGFRYQLGEDDPVVLPPRDNLTGRLADLWGREITNDLMPVYAGETGLVLEGYISKFYFYRSHGGDIRFFVNNRPVQYKPLLMLLRNAYGELMPKGKFPFAALFLSVSARDVDVNVHPQKREVRFREEVKVQNFLRQAFSRTIGAEGGISAASMVRLQVADKAAGVAPEPVFEPQSLFKPGLTTEFTSTTPAQREDFPEHLALHSRLYDTFIVATGTDALYLIDQHTAHERINYEKFLDLLADRKDIGQGLVHPLPVDSATFSRERLLQANTSLKSLGFELENLGPAGFALQAVPGYVTSGDELAALETALTIIERSTNLTSAELFDQLAKDLSCRHAIRKGETASLADFRELVDQLRKCRMPLRCPHGRPTIVRIDEKEIFAYFKRQV